MPCSSHPLHLIVLIKFIKMFSSSSYCLPLVQIFSSAPFSPCSSLNEEYFIGIRVTGIGGP
jgi:hypothetical protein